MRIAIAQMQCSLGDVPSNCARIKSLTDRAKDRGSDVVVFPELTDTGYEMRTVVENASSWEGAPFLTAKQAAIDCRVHVICGLSEREGDTTYNSVALIDPSGELVSRYRKTHLLSVDPVDENRYLAAGHSLSVGEIGGLKWGLLICYDLRFPEVSRQLVRRGVEVLVACAAWPFPRDSHWKALTVARAIENQCYVVAANRVGTDGPLTFCGSSRIVDPNGSVIAEGSDSDDELVVGDVAPEMVISTRQRFPALRDRREDLYRAWQAD